MAADIGHLFRVMNGYKDDGISKSTALVTRDLLGGGSNSASFDSQELELDLQVPSGFEKRLDLKVPFFPFFYFYLLSFHMYVYLFFMCLLCARNCVFVCKLNVKLLYFSSRFWIFSIKQWIDGLNFTFVIYGILVGISTDYFLEFKYVITLPCFSFLSYKSVFFVASHMLSCNLCFSEKIMYITCMCTFYHKQIINNQ